MFTSDVTERSSAEPGQPARVLDPRGRFLGIAHYNSASQITIRLLTRHNEPIDRAFYKRRIEAAAAHRSRIVENSEACRLIFSEADLLPGLIVDRYANYFVVQNLTQSMDAAKQMIAEILVELFQPDGILFRNDAPIRKQEDLPLETSWFPGSIETAKVTVRMNGIEFEADLVQGQKTGVYLDQRENYVAVARHAHGRALDCFTSTGGFALHLAKNCDSVLAIDSSTHAIETARTSAARNGITKIEFREANVFDYLAGDQGRYDTIILDPPAFTKSRAGLEGATRGYKDINFRALRLLEPGGVLVTCSCSHHMSEAMLLETIASAALDTGRNLRILERRTQAADHPILLTVPETLYLKCLIFQVLS